MKEVTQDKKETRARILLAAKREFAENGFNGSRMGSIARRARANQALIHYYFVNKQTLYIETLKHLTGLDRQALFNELFSSEELDIPERLYVYLYLMVNIHLKAMDPDLLKIIAREITEDRSDFRSMLFPYLMRRIEILEGIIRDGIKKGYFHTSNPIFTSMGAVSMILDYGNGRENLKNTPWFERLYSGKMQKEFCGFVIVNVFKSLATEKRGFSIPDISPHLKKRLDKMISEIRDKQTWYQEELGKV